MTVGGGEAASIAVDLRIPKHLAGLTRIGCYVIDTANDDQIRSRKKSRIVRYFPLPGDTDVDWSNALAQEGQTNTSEVTLRDPDAG